MSTVAPSRASRAGPAGPGAVLKSLCRLLTTSSLAPLMMRVIVPGHCLVNSQRRKQFASKGIRSVACKIVESDVLQHREKVLKNDSDVLATRSRLNV